MKIRFITLLLDPLADELGGGGGGVTTTSAAELPEVTNDGGGNDPSDLNTETPSADPAVTGGTVTPTPTPAPTQWQSIRDVARARGYNVGQEFQDDGAFLNHLLSQAGQAQQASVYARLGQQLAPHAGQIQNYLQQQQAPQQPEANPWEAPEFDERWLALVERDQATGLYYAKPGVDPQWAAKVNKFAEWKQNYDRNPAAVLNGMVEARAKKIADEQFNARFAERERQSAIQQIATANSEWLYQRDQATGQVVTDYQGRPMVTPAGARYLHHLQAVRGMGVTDPRHQDHLAKQMTLAEHHAAQAQATQQQQGQQNPQTRAAINNPNINPIQAAPPSQRRVNPHNTDEKVTGKSLSEMLREALQADGVTDDDVRASIGG